VYAEPLRAQGVAVESLGMARGRVSAGGLVRLRRRIAQFRPDVVQTRLYHADLLGGLMARLAGVPPVVWAVHATELGEWGATWKTHLVRRCCAWASRSVPTLIVSDARSTAALHQKLGYPGTKLVVIRNGVDASTFRPDAEARARVRSGWGVAADETLIGCVARWDPVKDHENLLRAVARLASLRADFRCALIGTGMTAENAELTRLIERCGVAARVILAGPTRDVPAAMNALDVHVLASRSESLPVVVMEAMACGTLCVVTDVGDARDIVGELGWVVPPRDAAALTDAIEATLSERRGGAARQRALAGRARVIEEFSLAHMAREYADLWRRAAEAHVP
jgi:glycosyltransferase involved in cell wall biosynthesis